MGTSRREVMIGAGAALPIWLDFVKDATGGDIRGAFLPPPNVVRLDIDPVSGARSLRGCPQSRSEVFLAGTEPTLVCDHRGVRALRRDRRRPKGGRSVLDWLSDVL